MRASRGETADRKRGQERRAEPHRARCRAPHAGARRGAAQARRTRGAYGLRRAAVGKGTRRRALKPPARVTLGLMARVLIIDDDVTLRQALTKHLEHVGHEVRQAADGDAGIRAYERHAADVVIVDIFMPGQGGLQTIGRLRREWPAVKIRSEEHTSELQSLAYLVCRLLLEKKKKKKNK